MSLIKVNKNENPYDVIGNYIEKHIPVIDDIIAVISIDGKICNELLLVDGEIGSTNNFVWQIDWWEGEENVELIDFFFVSDACKKCDNNDLISRQAAIDAVEFGITYAKKINKETGEVTVLFEESNAELEKAIDRIKQLLPAQPKRGKWIKNETTWTGYTCSVCGNVPYMQTCMGKPIYDYCPFCGSYNGGEINDQ